MTITKPIAAALLLAFGAGILAAPVSAGEAFPRRDGDLAIHDGMDRGDGDFRGRERHRGVRDCAPDDALGQAVADGIQRPNVADINRRSVVVEGHGRFGWGRMVFANMAGCPLILH